MATPDRRGLINRLNGYSRDTLEKALRLAKARTHGQADLEHWLAVLVDGTGSDFDLLLRHFEVDVGHLKSDIDKLLSRMRTGSARDPLMAVNIEDLARAAWLSASLNFEAEQVRSGHLLIELVADPSLRRLAQSISPRLGALDAEALKEAFESVAENSFEAQAEAALGAGAAKPSVPGAPGSVLDQFTTDLTARARAGQLDSVAGRDAEIRQMIDILMRRRQNNPILTGDAGVGKTALVEGFALRIAAGDVPEPLKTVSVRVLDLGLLQAGAGVRGEFENRLKGVIEAVKASPSPIILFIDEAHTLIGAGGAEGMGDAANLLKPALARGELKTIAATTWAEYKKYFERDAALARRFQVVKVEEPSIEAAILMMRGLVPALESHHRVRILDEAVQASVALSARYITGRQLPDKSVSVLDTAAARVAVGQGTIPARIEDLRRRLADLDLEGTILARETRTGLDHAVTLKKREGERAGLAEELAALEGRWAEERTRIAKIKDLSSRLETEAELPPDEALRSELAQLRGDLAKLQGETPLLHAVVDRDAIAATIASWTGIPVGRMVSDEIRGVLNLADRMAEQIRGQAHALDVIGKAVISSRAKLTDPRKPLGVFLLCGTSGVGKTETALALADLVYGGEQNLTVINMSEFKEEHKVSMLVGSPPGYVGYGEGGVLTEAVRRKPYSVILLDEMEKAHPGVQDVFYQVFDKGMLKDGQGRDIDFKNTLILMTSNAGTETIERLCADPDTMPDAEGMASVLRDDLLKFFKPAFLGRLTVVPYFPLPSGILREIVDINLRKISRRIQESYGAETVFNSEVVDAIVARCNESGSGARNIETILSRTVLPVLSIEILSRVAEGQTTRAIKISVDGQGALAYLFE